MFSQSNNRPLAVIAGLFLAITLPVSAYFRHAERNYDENRCYFPAVTQLRQKFPYVDLVEDSLSANPPGYTHLIAALSLLSGESTPGVRLCHTLVCAAGAVALARIFIAAFGPIGYCYALPLIFSTYYLKQACVLSTDDIAVSLTGIAFVLLLTANNSENAMLLAGGLSLFAIYCRHISAWVLVPFADVAMAHSFRRSRRSLTAIALATIALSSVLLVYFAVRWCGLVPPRFQRQVAGGGLSGVIYAIALVAVFSPFFVRLDDLFSSRSVVSDFRVAIICGTALFLLGPSNWSPDDGRCGGILWSLARYSPTVAQRALLFLPLLILGVYSLVRIIRTLYARSRDSAFIWLAGFCGWLATTIPNQLAYHRYFEPPVLLFLGTATALIMRGLNPPLTRLLVLAMTLAIAGVFALYGTDNGFASGAILHFRMTQ